MTCYLRLREIAVAVRAGTEGTDWDECLRLWRAADGVGGANLLANATADSSAAPIAPQLIEWVRQEARR